MNCELPWRPPRQGRVNWERDALGKTRYDLVAQEHDSKNEECVMNVDGQSSGQCQSHAMQATMEGNLPDT